MTSNTCRNCGATLVEDLKEAVDGTDRPAWLEFDGSKYFIRCQQCSATNILIMSEDRSGTSVLTITRAIMEDD